MDTASLIENAVDHLDAVRNRIAELREAQDESSDVGNADHLDAAEQALDGVEGALGDLVP